MSHIYIYSICTYTVLGFIVPFEYFYCKKKTVVLKLLKINVFLYIKAIYLSEIFLFEQFCLFIVLVNYCCHNATWQKKKSKQLITIDNYVLLLSLQIACGLAELVQDWPCSPGLVWMRVSVAPGLFLELSSLRDQQLPRVCFFFFSWWVTEFKVRLVEYPMPPKPWLKMVILFTCYLHWVKKTT